MTETLPVNPPAGWRFADPTYAPAQTVPIPDTDGASVKVTTTNTLLRNSGSLVLSKTGRRRAGGLDRSFPIGYNYTWAGSTVTWPRTGRRVRRCRPRVPSEDSCTVPRRYR